MSEPRCVIGVDVGGTKIRVGVVEVELDGRTARLLVADQITTPRVEPTAFYDALAELIRRVRVEAQRTGHTLLPLIGVGHPGRFLPDGRLARFTTPNIGTSGAVAIVATAECRARGRPANAPGQFDGINPAEELRRRIGGGVLVFAENDAIAQMRFGLAALLQDNTIRPQLLGQTVIYIGPGTGMGGGVARVSKSGEVTIVTDGHFFDLQLPDWGDGTLTAEELFTGPAIARLVTEANRRLMLLMEPRGAESRATSSESRGSRGIQPADAKRIGELLADAAALPRPESEASSRGLPAHRAEAQRIVDHAGTMLAEIIRTIHAGRIVKVRLDPLPDGTIRRYVDEPDRAWSDADKAAVRNATRYILGGSVGINRVLGGALRARALDVLRRHSLTDIRIFQIPVSSADAGVLGAALAIPH